MVKGCSKQVIVVHSPEEKLFEQAIFILKDNVTDVTDDALMKEASRLIQSGAGKKSPPLYAYGPVWACGGALVTGVAWLLTVLF